MSEDNQSNLTLKLLRIIGSPFESGNGLAVSKDEASELYDLAKINKVGLTYLSALAAQSRLQESGLETEYQQEMKKQRDQEITIKRVAEVFDSTDIPYVVIKSIMPFPALPNDVDVLFLGSNKEYAEAANRLKQSGFKEIREASVPLCVPFYDMRQGLYSNKGEKGPFNVDLYEEISAASHLIYLAKRKLGKHVTETTILGKSVKILQPEVDLLVIITHSIIEVQLYTLLIHYATLHYLARLDSPGIDRLISLAKENNITFALKVHFSLAINLEKLARRAVPEKLKGIQAKLGVEQKEAMISRKRDFRLPHHYSLLTIARVLLGKTKEKEFSHSSVRQAISMLNPKEFGRIVRALSVRRSRTIY